MIKDKVNKIKKIKVYELVEFVFLILLGLYLLFLVEKTTTYHFEYTTDIDNALFGILRIVTVIKLFCFLWSKKNEILGDKLLARKLIVYLFFAMGLRIIYHMVYQTDKYRFLLFLGILILGTIGSDYKKIMKVHVIAGGLMTGAAVLGSLGGFITNYAYLKEGGVIHSSWGMVYSTDYASIVLFLCIIAWIAWINVDPRVFLILGIVSLLNAIFIARSNTCTIVGVTFLVAIIVESMHQINIKKAITILIEMSFPIFTVLTFMCTYLYHKGTGLGIKLNSYFHGRLRLLDDGIKKYKFSLFGTPFTQSGDGGSSTAS